MNTLRNSNGGGASRVRPSRAICVAALGIAVSSTLLGACRKAESPQALVVYAPDSFAGEWGPGPLLAKGFREATGAAVLVLGKGDAGQVLSEAILERKRPKASVVIGIDQNMLAAAAASGILSRYDAPALSSIPERLRFDPEKRVIPFDHGAFAIIWDSQSGIQPPSSLDDLLLPRYRKSLILMDPRTSSPGLGFLAWTLSAKGEGWKEYWQALMPNVLTIAPGWDTGYNLFLGGEAPLVLSYCTSPAYHAEYEKTDRYKALVFSDGHAVQIEGVAIVKGAPHRAQAEALVDYLLSPGFQRELPLTNWMLPAVEGVALPPSYSAVPQVVELPSPPRQDLTAALEEWPDRAR